MRTPAIQRRRTPPIRPAWVRSPPATLSPRPAPTTSPSPASTSPRVASPPSTTGITTNRPRRRDRARSKSRRRRDSNPRSFRSTVFKTVAFDHSATPPKLTTIGTYALGGGVVNRSCAQNVPSCTAFGPVVGQVDQLPVLAGHGDRELQ